MGARGHTLAALLAGASLLGCGEDTSSGFDNTRPFAGGRATSSAGSSNAGTSGGGSGPVPPPLTGQWVLHGYAAPFAIDLDVASPTDGEHPATGKGCYEGPWELEGTDCGPQYVGSPPCGSLRGRVIGTELTFSVVVDDPHFSSVYSANAYGAQDGSRMAGSFWKGLQEPPLEERSYLGWIPLSELASGVNCRILDAPAPDLGDFDLHLLERDFVLQRDAAVGWIQPGESVHLHVTEASGLVSVTGKLGAFWNPDYHWNALTQTLSLGPVPATVPGMPVSLQVHVGGGNVVATTAEGESGTFLPVPLPMPVP